MNTKYYAVRQGRNVGIYTTWDECNAQVKGYSGAEFKKFESLEEAKAFLGRTDSQGDEGIAREEIVAYVDGSFDVDTGDFAYGLVLIDDQGNEETFNGAMNHPEYSLNRNVAGEVFASMKAIELAIERNKKKVYIHFDYMGIKAWAEGTWKTNKELTQKYKAFVEEKRDLIEIEFIKVKAHSNDKYNDMADSLAKKALDK